RRPLVRMRSACDAGRMARMLQVRNLPDEVHARLKERAAAERMSLSDYVARELEDLVRYRSNAEVLEAPSCPHAERMRCWQDGSHAASEEPAR
ncbi:hypothetical protein CTI14_61030, partial [Methylobacterium radiotolerans]